MCKEKNNKWYTYNIKKKAKFLKSFGKGAIAFKQAYFSVWTMKPMFSLHLGCWNWQRVRASQKMIPTAFKMATTVPLSFVKSKKDACSAGYRRKEPKFRITLSTLFHRLAVQ